MNFLDVPVFDTTGKVICCTKFLINRVNSGSLWLDREYIIHIDNIYQLIRLSMEGEDVSKGFQNSRKHGRKKGGLNLYDNFGAI
jgi:hypothetical protein